MSMNTLIETKRLIRQLTLERDAARELAEKAVNALQATKQELTGLLTVVWLLASKEGGSITLTDSELLAMPAGARVRSSFDTEQGIYTYSAEAIVPPQAGSENIADDTQGEADLGTAGPAAVDGIVLDESEVLAGIGPESIIDPG